MSNSAEEGNSMLRVEHRELVAHPFRGEERIPHCLHSFSSRLLLHNCSTWNIPRALDKLASPSFRVAQLDAHRTPATTDVIIAEWSDLHRLSRMPAFPSPAGTLLQAKCS